MLPKDLKKSQTGGTKKILLSSDNNHKSKKQKGSNGTSHCNEPLLKNGASPKLI